MDRTDSKMDTSSVGRTQKRWYDDIKKVAGLSRETFIQEWKKKTVATVARGVVSNCNFFKWHFHDGNRQL